MAIVSRHSPQIMPRARRPGSRPRWLRISLWGWGLLLAAAGAWLVAADVVPGGRLEISDTFGRLTPYLRRSVPADRVVGPLDDRWWGRHVQVVGEPVYLDVRLPRQFRALTWELRYHPGDAAIIELGVVHPERPQEVLLQPLFHRQLESLAQDPNWQVRVSGDLLLLARGTTTVGGVEDFLRSPPAPERINRYRLSAALLAASRELPLAGPDPGVDFIVARYQLSRSAELPAGAAPWRTARRTFPLPAQLARAREIRLVISVPQRQFSPQPPRVGAYRVVVEGEPLNFRILREWLGRWFRTRA